MLSVGRSGSGSGGDVTVRAGETLAGTGGAVRLDAGSGDVGGNVTIAAGVGRAAAGGDLFVTSGASTTTGASGEISFQSGESQAESGLLSICTGDPSVS